VKAHRTVIAHERWYQKGPPFLGKPFTVKKTVQRHATLINILSRAGKRAARAGNDELADAYRRLQAKLTRCRPRRRCGLRASPTMQGRPAGKSSGRTDHHHSPRQDRCTRLSAT
jgi:hypothetical protein